MSEERLQKILARAGIASRRKAEEMIEAGQVALRIAPSRPREAMASLACPSAAGRSEIGTHTSVDIGLFPA